jgi:type II secretory pathway pseudopilin PulG
MTDDRLTEFRADVPLPDDASAKRTYERAVGGRRRLPRRRLLYALAVVIVVGGLAGGLSSTLGGASSNVNPERQQIADEAMAQVQQALGGDRLLKATLDGSLLTIDGKNKGLVNGAVEPFEELVLAHVADEKLRAAGYEGVETINGKGFGGASLAPLSNIPQLSADACDIPAGTKLAEVTAAAGRTIPLLRGFCVIHLTTAHPTAFAGYAQETLNQLFAAVPPAKGSQGRGVVIEADDESGAPVIVIAWGPSVDQGGSISVRPDLECETSLVTPPVGRCGSGSGNG